MKESKSLVINEKFSRVLHSMHFSQEEQGRDSLIAYFFSRESGLCIVLLSLVSTLHSLASEHTIGQVALTGTQEISR